MNKWLSAQRVRILFPLVGLATFASTMLGALVYNLVFAGPAHHYYWRELLFGSMVITLGAVTGLKFRQQDPRPAAGR